MAGKVQGGFVANKRFFWKLGFDPAGTDKLVPMDTNMEECHADYC